MLSFLKLVKKLSKNVIWNLAVCCGAIRRYREKLQYRCTSTIPHVHNTPKMFWKIYFLCDFWCAQTCSFRVIFRLDALAKALSVIATATWLAGWLGGWVAGCHTPVLYQNR